MCRNKTPEWASYLLWFQAETIHKINRLGIAMSEVQDAVDAVTAQVSKGTAEVVAQVAALEAQAAAGVAPDLTALKAAAQALDDLNVDPAPVEPPVEPTV